MTPEQIEKERQAFNEWHKRTIRENPEMIEEIEGNSAEQG
ncbi:hypothetical protein HMPREF9371_0593 [Neisseria shayeganii 871]|uniref:Uncharacterized protein n=1 Tax=Neisseria shayeganii 871 TaxID=1032488 RepID=G4CG54_9NEIS|nr:hypothetical protein HMPREF9371_0593 [Neisseria shayeganii 871]